MVRSQTEVDDGFGTGCQEARNDTGTGNRVQEDRERYGISDCVEPALFLLGRDASPIRHRS